MKKKGISLILLVITIIIIIIIASAVILNLNNNNPVDKARLANVQQTRDSLKSGINLYIAKIMVKENGNHNASTMILGKNTSVSNYSIIYDYSVYKTIRGNLNVWQLNYDEVNSKVSIKLGLYDANSRWFIDEYGNPYLVYDKLSNVSPYLKDETGNVLSSVRDFVVYLNQDVEFAENTQPSVSEPEEDLTVNVAITNTSNGVITISGFSRKGIKSIIFDGPREGVLTPTVNGKNYSATAIVGNGDYTFTIRDNDDEVLEREVSVSGVTSYIVATVDDFCKFRDYVNGGDNFENITITQINDIDLSSVCSSVLGSWTPIGSTGTYFAGTYDGGNYSISNLYINTNEYVTLGMFIQTATTSNIKNLKLDNVYINNTFTGNDYSRTGTIVGRVYGKIENCGINSGNVRAVHSNKTILVGGITGQGVANNNGVISNCYCKANIYGQSNTEVQIGGIIGNTDSSSTTITNCYNTGNITYSSGNLIYIGGIIGLVYRTNTSITNCYSTISGNNLNGIVGGVNNCTPVLTNCYCLANATCGATLKTSNELKALSSTLGEVYKSDTNNINDGYPILKWE